MCTHANGVNCYENSLVYQDQIEGIRYGIPNPQGMEPKGLNSLQGFAPMRSRLIQYSATHM